MEAAVEFKHPLYQLERNTKHNGRGGFSLVTQSTLQKMATSIEAVGVFKLIQLLKILTRATEETKRSWIYMRENGVDSPYLFLHCVFSIDASPAHP